MSLSRIFVVKLVLAALLLPLLPQALKAQESPAVKILVLDVKGGAQSDGAELDALTQGLVQALASQPNKNIVGLSDISSLVKAKEIQQLTGCNDERCVANLAHSAAADQIVSARIGRLGKKQLLWLALVDSKNAGVQARAAIELGRGKNLQKSLRKAAKALFSAEAETLGDRSFADLRVALVFDEFDENGRSLPVHGVEACLTKQFLQAGVQMVSPNAIAAIKKQADPRLLALHKNLEALNIDDVDLIVAGVVEISPLVLGKDSPLQIKSSRGDLSLSMFRVDSGEILASEQQNSTQPGHSKQSSRAAVDRQLCKKIKPALAKALAKSRERGEGIRIKVRGLKSQQQARSLVKSLASLAHVGRVKLRHFSAKNSSVDLVSKGVDGMGLAIDISNSNMKATVVDASPAKLVLQVK